MGLLKQKIAKTASAFTRVDGENTEQTITVGESILHSVTLTGDGAAGTLLISNGAAGADDLTILEIESGKSQTFQFNVRMSTGIRVTPGEVTTDCLIIYDGP